jgi:N-hydroxyarylamine O-acetyltransferase
MAEERERVADAFDIDLDAYLARIGYKGSLAPTIETLTGLHYAHTTSVPFENLDILLGEGISLDTGALETKLVTRRRGGYCFEQNTYFAAVCEKLGFPVERLAARVRFGATGVRPRTHMLLSIRVGSEPWLADVGFGRVGPLYPIRMDQSEAVSQGAWALRIVNEKGISVLQAPDCDGWLDLYEFTAEPQYPVDFEVANHYTSTHPGSPFVHNLVAQRGNEEARWSLHNHDLTTETPGQKSTETLPDDAAILGALADVFDLRFPEGTRFRFGT